LKAHVEALSSLERHHIPKKARDDWPSDRAALANGLFARLTDAVDHGRFTEAAEARAKLAELGFHITMRPDRTRRPERKGVER
jgi:hypothetical protein